VKARRVKKLDPAGTLVENAARIVTVRLDEVRSFVPAAFDPEAGREQHDLRIAAKRLRYVLEVTGFCFGRPAEAARKRARDLQDVLGELHDCDVMLPRIERHIAELRAEDADFVRELAGESTDLEPSLVARAPHRTSFRGLEVLAVYVQARRKLLHERFVGLWAELERAGTWRRLERALERNVARAVERGSAADRAAAAERANHAAEELAAARRARADDGSAEVVRPFLRRVQ
jgi:CHAD domain